MTSFLSYETRKSQGNSTLQIGAPTSLVPTMTSELRSGTACDTLTTLKKQYRPCLIGPRCCQKFGQFTKDSLSDNRQISKQHNCCLDLVPLDIHIEATARRGACLKFFQVDCGSQKRMAIPALQCSSTDAVPWTWFIII